MNTSSEFVPGQEPSTWNAPAEQGTIRDLLWQQVRATRHKHQCIWKALERVSAKDADFCALVAGERSSLGLKLLSRTMERYIHGIQMIPLSPALLLARTPTFSQLEWNLCCSVRPQMASRATLFAVLLRSEILCHLPLSPADPWTPVLLTGGLAMFDSDRALET